MSGCVSELHRAGGDVEHGGVKLLPFEWRAFSVPALLQHLVHFLWTDTETDVKDPNRGRSDI